MNVDSTRASDSVASDSAASRSATKSSGFPALDDWARTRIKRCRFAPALRDGRPVWSSYNTSVYFDEAH